MGYTVHVLNELATFTSKQERLTYTNYTLLVQNDSPVVVTKQMLNRLSPRRRCNFEPRRGDDMMQAIPGDTCKFQIEH